MPTLTEVKYERLRAQAEREIIQNELIKGEIVRWQDVMAILGPKLADIRNLVLSWPAAVADKLSREDVEAFRKHLYAALDEAANVDPEEVRRLNRKVLTRVKMAA